MSSTEIDVGDDLSDDVVPPNDPPHTAPTKRRTPTDKLEAERDLSESGTDDSPQSLAQMVRMRPFLRLFVAYADVRYSRRQSLASRVDALAAESPCFYKWCKRLDLVFVAGICALVLVAALLNIIKVLL